MQRVFKINTAKRYGELWLHVEGELDLATAPVLAKEIAEAERTDALVIVVDLSQVSFIDTTGARTLLEADARSQQDAGRLRITRGGAAAVENDLELCGVLDRLSLIH